MHFGYSLGGEHYSIVYLAHNVATVAAAALAAALVFLFSSQ